MNDRDLVAELRAADEVQEDCLRRGEKGGVCQPDLFLMAADEIERLRQPTWTPRHTSDPEAKGYYAVVHEDSPIPAVEYWTGKRFSGFVTHWMPLPKVPE